MTDPEPPVRVRPATPADRDQVWPLASTPAAWASFATVNAELAATLAG